MGVRDYLVTFFVSCSVLGNMAYAEILNKPGASVSAKAKIPINIPISEEQRRFVVSYSSSNPLSYKMDIKLVESNEHEVRSWIQQSLESYGTVIFSLYVHFINFGNNIDSYNGEITVNVPQGIRNASMLSLGTDKNISKIKFKFNQETNTISFNVNKNDCYFVLVDEKTATNSKKSRNSVKMKSSVSHKSLSKSVKSKTAKQKRTADTCLNLEEILVSPWIFLPFFFWYDDSKKKNVKARRYRGYQPGLRYARNRYLKYKGVRYK